MSDLKAGTTIGGQIAWSGANLPLLPSDNSLYFKNFLIYSENDKPTKADVGLSSVENYGIASQSEAESGASNVKYMTPLRSQQLLTTHASLDNNPHGVTKEQVQLGLVQNYGLASTSEAQSGTVNNKYMTPLRNQEHFLSKTTTYSRNLLTKANGLDARTLLDVYSTQESDDKFLDEASNLSDLTDIPSARTTLQVYSKTESDGKYSLLGHTHSASDITSGTLSSARLPTITSGMTNFANQSLNTNSSPTFSNLTINLSSGERFEFVGSHPTLKAESTGGWAREYRIEGTETANATFGASGSGASVNYVYIAQSDSSTSTYSSGNALRIYDTYPAWGTNKLYHEGHKPTPSEIGAAAASHSHSYLPLSGGTLTGNLLIDRGANTALTVKSGDSGNAVVNVHGDSQGTGVVYVGQSSEYGGGIFYNGDAPSYAQSESSDQISFFRRSGGTNTVVMEYSHNNSVVNFKTTPEINGNAVYHEGHKPSKTDVGLSRIPNLNVTDSATSNTIMQRNSNGDTWCRLFRSTYSSTNSNIAAIYTTQTIGGDYMRPSTPAQVKSAMGLSNVPNWSSSTFDSRYAAKSHSHNYLYFGGTSFSGRYPVCVKVSGNIIYSNTGIEFDGSNNGLYVSGQVRGSSFRINSDKELKNNIKSISTNKGIQLKEWIWKDQDNVNEFERNKYDTGVIAQDVEKEFPTCTSKGEDGIRTVDYGKLGVHHSIKLREEYESEIELLKEQINKVQRRTLYGFLSTLINKVIKGFKNE